ncbi:MAG: hypothetical protein HYV27_08875 [Candidatus Hydrogenedentes bacterium]|nr:hypothetical protein [Candidatus Hydrogenedentota bacterium]
MQFLDRVKRGWRLGWGSFRVVWNDKSLLAFPLTSFTVTVFTVWFFYLIANGDANRMIFNTLANNEGVLLINWGYYKFLLVACFLLFFAAVFANVALAGCAHLSMEVRDSRFADGLKIAARQTHWILVWTIIASTLGLVLNLLDSFRYTSRWVRKLLGANWSIMTYFVIPILVLERTNVFSALRGSVRLATGTWGENLHLRAGMRSFLLLLNLPQLLPLILYFTIQPNLAFLVVWAAFLYFYLSLVVFQTVHAITAVVLYKYAKTGQPPEGFDAELLDSIFDGRRQPSASAIEAAETQTAQPAEAPDVAPPTPAPATESAPANNATPADQAPIDATPAESSPYTETPQTPPPR